MSFVLDSSAVLALLWDEPGAERVADALSGARISTVNLAEVVSKLIDRGASDREAVDVVENLALEAVPFGADQAETAGLMRRSTRTAGLSLGDRACLALARRDGAIAMTADRAWTGLGHGVGLDCIR